MSQGVKPKKKSCKKMLLKFLTLISLLFTIAEAGGTIWDRFAGNKDKTIEVENPLLMAENVDSIEQNVIMDSDITIDNSKEISKKNRIQVYIIESTIDSLSIGDNNELEVPQEELPEEEPGLASAEGLDENSALYKLEKGKLLFRQKDYPAAQALFEAALEANDASSENFAGEIHFMLGKNHVALGGYEPAKTHLSDALVQAKYCGNLVMQMDINTYLGICFWHTDNKPLARGFLQSAEDIYDGLDEIPESAQLLMRWLGYVRETQNREMDALPYYTTAIEILENSGGSFSNIGWTYFSKGRIYVEQKEWSPALQCYKKAIAAYEKEPENALELGKAYYEAGFICTQGGFPCEDALAFFEDALPLLQDQKDTEWYCAKINYFSGWANNCLGLYEPALSQLNAALGFFINKSKYEVDLAYCYKWIGKTYDSLGNIPDAKENYCNAITFFDKYLDCENETAWLYFSLGCIQVDQEDYGPAISSYQSAVDIWGKAPEYEMNVANAHLNFGTLYLKKEDPEMAIPHFEQALEIFKEDPDQRWNLADTYDWLGEAYKQKGEKEDYDNAIACYYTAVEIWVELPSTQKARIDTFFRLGSVQETIGENSHALGTYNAVLDICEQNPGLDQEKAKAFFEIGYLEHDNASYADAITNFEKARGFYEAIDDINMIAQAYFRIGLAHYRDDDSRAALSQYDLAYEKWSNLPDSEQDIAKVSEWKGYAYYSLGDFDSAITEFEKALEKYGKYKESTSTRATVLKWLGYSYGVADKYEPALKYMKDALDLYENELKSPAESAYCCAEIAHIYFMLHNYPDAINWVIRADTMIGEGYDDTRPAWQAIALNDSFVLTPLAKGDKSDEVKAMQSMLVETGFLKGTPDGDYGNMTVEAVAAYQTAMGLEATGTADEATLRMILTAQMPE